MSQSYVGVICAYGWSRLFIVGKPRFPWYAFTGQADVFFQGHKRHKSGEWPYICGFIHNSGQLNYHDAKSHYAHRCHSTRLHQCKNYIVHEEKTTRKWDGCDRYAQKNDIGWHSWKAKQYSWGQILRIEKIFYRWFCETSDWDRRFTRETRRQKSQGASGISLDRVVSAKSCVHIPDLQGCKTHSFCR